MKPIENDAEHDAAMREIERLWSAQSGSADEDRLDVLTALVEVYEDAQFPMDVPTPVAPIL